MNLTQVMAWAAALALASALPSQVVTVAPNEEMYATYTAVPGEPTPPGPVGVYTIRLGEEVYGIVTAPEVLPPLPCPPGVYSLGESEVFGVFALPPVVPPPPVVGKPSVVQTELIYGVFPPPPAVAWPNPVPTRIEGTYFGYQFHPKTAIKLECYIYGDEYSSIRLSGGEPGAEAVLFCADKAELNWTPWGAFLVPTSCVTIPGFFNAEGVFEYPVNLGLRELCEETFYFQGVEWKGDENPVLSWGLALRYAPGNEQPPLVYHEPAMQAILCKTVLEEVAILHSVLIRFEAAASYELSVDDIVYGPGGMKTKIYVSLSSPGGPFGPNEWHRAAVDIGKRAVTPWVEVWVALDHTGGKRTYERGAVIKTEF